MKRVWLEINNEGSAVLKVETERKRGQIDGGFRMFIRETGYAYTRAWEHLGEIDGIEL